MSYAHFVMEDATPIENIEDRAPVLQGMLEEVEGVVDGTVLGYIICMTEVLQEVDDKVSLVEDKDAEDVSGDMETHEKKGLDDNEVQAARVAVSKILEDIFDSIFNVRCCVSKNYDAIEMVGAAEAVENGHNVGLVVKRGYGFNDEQIIPISDDQSQSVAMSAVSGKRKADVIYEVQTNDAISVLEKFAKDGELFWGPEPYLNKTKKAEQ